MTDIVERLRLLQKYQQDNDAGEAADTIEALLAENARLREALKRVLADIEDYERVNNLAPNPGREHCWDSVRAARKAMGETE